jgi:hypothetical protein
MIVRFLESILVRVPLALVIFFISIKQNNLFNSDQIIFLGSVISSSVLYSILFLQPLGNIFNRMIGKNQEYHSLTFIDYRVLILYLFIFVSLFSLISLNYFFLVLAFNLATAQAFFQWCISYLTVNDKKKELFSLCFVLIFELLLVVYFFDFQNYSVQCWIFLLIVSYYFPSFLFFSLCLDFKDSFQNLKTYFFSFVKIFIFSASFFTILSLFFWMIEFFPRMATLFNSEFKSSFNVYMTFAIGLVGALDSVLNQFYLKKYLILSVSNHKMFVSYFFRIIKVYASLFFFILLLLMSFNHYYWDLIFDSSRFNDFSLFYFIFFIEVIRILAFHSFNAFFYMDRLDLIKNTVFLLVFTSSVIILLSFVFKFSGFLYLLIFLIICFLVLISNLFKLHKSL